MIIAHLATHNIPNSAIKAAAMLNEETLSLEEYNARIEDLGADTSEITDHREAKYTYLYTVQNGIQTGVVDILKANEQAHDMLKRLGWSFVELTETDEIVDKKTGEVRKKKGWKKTEAIKIAERVGLDKRKELIQMFQDELDMTKQGATSYFYIVKDAIRG